MSDLKVSELPLATEIEAGDVLVGNVGSPAVTSRVSALLARGWTAVTQDEYDLLTPDPNTLYVIVPPES
jgi:hypothetical protein